MRALYVGESSYKIINICNGSFLFDINGHIHSSESYEIHFCLSGKGNLILDDKTYELKEDMIYVTGPNIWNRQIINKTDPLNELCIYIQKVQNGNDRLSRIFNSTHFWIGESNKTTRDLFSSILEINNQKTYYANEKKNHMVGLIITELSNMYAPEFVLDIDDTVDDTKFMIIEMAFLYDYPFITLEELSKRLCMSQRQTQRILNDFYGASFREKLTKARLEAAILKMLNGKNVSTAAIEVGYANPQSFIRAFKKHYDKTPTEYAY